jgi:alcohol dehydrogenase class IV
MYKLYCRIYQVILKFASHIMPWRKPEIIEGVNSLERLPELIRTKGIDTVLIVTDKVIASLGLMNTLINALNENKVKYIIYDKTVPNPTIANIEEALKLYKDNNCSSIIAFGGGSPMDCAKGVGARVARPSRSIPKMKGQLKLRRKIPPFFAVPTTSGSGSEATLAAVISNSKTHEKYAINDMALIPHYAVLDPLLTQKLPQHITSTTGMDALTHAIEAYVGKSNTRETRECSIKAVKLIFDNIYEAYSNGDNLEARASMQKASYFAGIAFTRAYVGNVHAIAHTLGGFYSTPHGLANAVILPYVLEYYGKSIYKPLSELADVAGIGEINDDNKTKTEKFIEAIKELNVKMNIPQKIDGIVESDIPLMVERALNEANPLYPVPMIFGKEDMLKLYDMIRK